MNEEAKQFEQMIIKGRETGEWAEGTEWSTAERHVYEELLNKAEKLMTSGIAKNKEQAMSEAVKLYFCNRRYYQTREHADYPSED